MEHTRVSNGVYYGIVDGMVFSTDSNKSRVKLKKDFNKAEVIHWKLVPTRDKSLLLQAYTDSMLLSVNPVK